MLSNEKEKQKILMRTYKSQMKAFCKTNFQKKWLAGECSGKEIVLFLETMELEEQMEFIEKMPHSELAKIIPINPRRILLDIITEFLEEEIYWGEITSLFETIDLEGKKCLIVAISEGKLERIILLRDVNFLRNLVEFLNDLSDSKTFGMEEEKIFGKIAKLLQNDRIVWLLLPKLKGKVLRNVLTMMQNQTQVLAMCDLLVQWNKRQQILDMFEDKLEFKMRGGEGLSDEILYENLFHLGLQEFVAFYKQCLKIVKIELLERIFLGNSQFLSRTKEVDTLQFQEGILIHMAKATLEMLKEEGEISPLESLFLHNCKENEKEIYCS